MSNLDARINKMAPGARVEIGACGNVRTYVERSGDGATLRFVRETTAGFVVFRTVAFTAR